MTLTVRSSVVRSARIGVNPISDALTYFGDSVPVTGLWPQAFHDATANKSWFSYAGTPDASARKIYIKTYDHGSGSWYSSRQSAGTIIGNNPSTDSHGEPGAVMDQYGFAHVFTVEHIGAMKYYYTTTARDPSAWTAGPDIVGGNQNTCSCPVLCNGVIYVFTQGFGLQVTYYTGTPSPSGGVSSWSSEKAITNFGANSYGWLGNPIVIGTKIYFAFSFAPLPNTYIADCYFGYLETSDGSFHNVNSSTVVAAGSLPINRATAKANFMVFETPSTAESTVIPSFAFDPVGNPVVMYANGTVSNTSTSAGTYTLYSSRWNGSAWTAGVQVAGTAQCGFFFSLPTLVSTASGITAYWGQKNGSLQDAYTANWTIAGGWSSATRIKAAYRWNISNFVAVANGTAQARVMFSEESATAVGGAALPGNLAVWAYGDNGFI